MRNATLLRGTLVKGLALILGAMALGSSAFAAGIDSRTYSCADLQALIAAKGYVFIAEPAFGDFVVANLSYCPAENIIQWRSVPTTDRPDCPVNYCVGRSSGSSN